MSIREVVPVLHNVYSPQKVVESARLVYGLGYKTLVISKAMGSAAQAGVPDAQRMAFKLGRSLLYFSDLDVVLELLSPSAVYTIAPPPYAEQQLDLEELAARASEGLVVVVFGGSEPGLSRRELERGTAAYPPGISSDVGTLGLMAITLYLIARAIQS